MIGLVQVLNILKIQKSGYFLLIVPCACAGAAKVQYSTGILRILNRLIKVRQKMFQKYINLYLLKTVSVFTLHSLFDIVSTMFSLYPEIWKIQKFSSTLGPSFPDKWLSTCNNTFGTMLLIRCIDN